MSDIIMKIGACIGGIGIVCGLIWAWILAYRTKFLWFLAAVLLFPAGTTWFLVLNRPRTNKILALLLVSIGAIFITTMIAFCLDG